jgi:predicted nucleotidyltransferase component of viral defense system
MVETLHWNILDSARLAILPQLKDLAGEAFYLAGGTGLALQLGHRDSIDFDFFTLHDFDTKHLISKLEIVFSGHKISITQEEKNTLSCVIDNSIQCSFFTYSYPTVRPFVESEYLRIASIEDIGCMKFSAITGRSVEKDYVDLYFILKRIPLAELLSLSVEKHASLDEALILKSLVYFDDVQREPILLKEGNEVSFDVVKEFLQKTVSGYFQHTKI